VDSKKIKSAVLKTIAYADIFDFPLKEEEVFKFLIETRTSKAQVAGCLEELVKAKKISSISGFYFLPDRGKIVVMRRKREKYSVRKLKIARKAAKFIKIFPSVKLIGLTGALAVSNSKKDDDIDFLIVTSGNLLWTTRFLTTVILSVLGLKRKRNATSVADKICLNMFIDESSLSFSDHNLFLAHEILQLSPIYQKDDIYQKFLQKNIWVLKFLPNWPFPKTKEQFLLNKKITLKLFLAIEKLLKKAQLVYMYPHITTEKISDKLLKFHPRDMRKIVLSKYQQKIKTLDKIKNSP